MKTNLSLFLTTAALMLGLVGQAQQAPLESVKKPVRHPRAVAVPAMGLGLTQKSWSQIAVGIEFHNVKDTDKKWRPGIRTDLRAAQQSWRRFGSNDFSFVVGKSLTYNPHGPLSAFFAAGAGLATQDYMDQYRYNYKSGLCAQGIVGAMCELGHKSNADVTRKTYLAIEGRYNTRTGFNAAVQIMTGLGTAEKAPGPTRILVGR